MADGDTTRREFLKRAGTVAWVAPVITAVQAAPAAGVTTSVTTTTVTSTTIPED